MTTDTQPIIDAALASAVPSPLDKEGRIYSVVNPDGGVVIIDVEAERRKIQDLDAPRRKTGVYALHDAASFLAYVDKHGDGATEVWADTTRSTITAVLDAHEGDLGGPRFEQHRATYAVLLTDAWKAWAALDGKLLDQEAFAQHIEDRSIDIIRPNGADMLELAQSFHATIGVHFDSSKALSSGERQLTYREDINASAGKAGQMDIPASFDLGLVPFEGADAFPVTARFRYRIVNGTLRIGYHLERPADVLRTAFLDVVSHIEEGIDGPVLRGAR